LSSTSRTEETLLWAYAHKAVCTKQPDGESSLTFYAKSAELGVTCYMRAAGSCGVVPWD